MSRRNLEVGVDGVAKVQFVGMDVVGWMLESVALMRWISWLGCSKPCKLYEAYEVWVAEGLRRRGDALSRAMR